MVMSAEQQLQMNLTTVTYYPQHQAFKGTKWRVWREKLKAVAQGDRTDEKWLFSVVEVIVAAQRKRRQYALAALPKTLPKEDARTVEVSLRETQRYRDGIVSDVEALRTWNAPTEIQEVLNEEIQFCEDYILYHEDSLRGRGLGRSKVDEIVEPIAANVELQLALREKFDGLKGTVPQDRWPDIERAFRQAMEQIDK